MWSLVRPTIATFVSLWLIASSAIDAAPAVHAGGESRLDNFDRLGPLDRPAFTLGNAARGFGWSTAIGDFNADGRPDVITADRLLPRAGGYGYRIQFAISGQAPADVTFESARDAVAISVSDVDSDNDLDLVAHAALSGEPVGLWLNDGHGALHDRRCAAHPGGHPRDRQPRHHRGARRSLDPRPLIPSHRRFPASARRAGQGAADDAVPAGGQRCGAHRRVGARRRAGARRSRGAGAAAAD